MIHFVRIKFVITCLVFFIITASSLTYGESLLVGGYYRVTAGGTNTSHIPCRYTPSKSSQVRLWLPVGTHVKTERLVNHFNGMNVWFYINAQCFLPADSAFLQFRGVID